MPELDRTDGLDAALRSLAGRVEFPPTPSLAPAVASRLRAADAARRGRPPFPGVALWSRRRLVVAIALGLVLLGGAAVAARLGLGAISIHVVPSLAPSATPEGPAVFGPERSVGRVQAAVRFGLGWPPALGWPGDAFVARPGIGPAGAVLAWRDVPGYDRIPGTPWDAVLLELPGQMDIAAKSVLAESIEPARVHGHPAFWVSGPHDLGLQGAAGGAVVRVSGNVLIWERSPGVTYRLETMLPKREAIALAETLA